jgi:putative transposase
VVVSRVNALAHAEKKMKHKLPEKGSQQLRKGRLSWPGCYYFVSSAKADDAPQLDNHECFSIICSEARRLEDEQLWECHALVLMPDHLHMVVRLGEGADLSKVMNLFKGRISRKLNQAGIAKGRAWYRGFHDHLIRQDQPIPNFLDYILHNPTKAHLVKITSDWPYLFVKDRAFNLL